MSQHYFKHRCVDSRNLKSKVVPSLYYVTQAKGIKNIEDLMREKGEEVRRINAADSPQDLEFVQGEDDGNKVNQVEKLK